MVSFTKAIFLWLAGFSCLQGLAQHLDSLRKSQENQTLVFKVNATFGELMNTSHGKASLRNTTKTNHPNRYGEKVKLVIKKENMVKKLRYKESKNSSTNRCGEKCCPGWTIALKTGTCTRAVCTPKCKNRGVCKKPQKCTCKMGFEGPYCERRNSSLTTKSSPAENVPSFTPSSLKMMSESQDVTENSGDPSPAEPPILQSQFPSFTTKTPTTTTKLALPTITSEPKFSDIQTFNHPPKNGTLLSWQLLTVHELQSILQRKGLSAKDKMTALLTKHLEAQKTQKAKENGKERPRTPNAIRTPKGEFNVHKQIQDSGECTLPDDTVCD